MLNELPLPGMRYFIQLSYDGTKYSGWQTQHNAVAVQQVVTHCLSTLLGTEVECVGSGRTDAGVHARVQVVHVDMGLKHEPEEFLYRLNSLLPHDIAAHWVKPVRPEAHARFDAESRSYEYHIHQKKDPFKTNYSYLFRSELDVDAMNKTAALMLTWKDFQSFSKVKTDVKHFDCDIFEACWRRENDSLVFYVSANRFLRGMVRAVVGTLLEAGQGRLSQAEFKEILESRDRKSAARNVPAEGLFLTNVTYPEEIYILS